MFEIVVKFRVLWIVIVQYVFVNFYVDEFDVRGGMIDYIFEMFCV